MWTVDHTADRLSIPKPSPLVKMGKPQDA